LNQSFQSLAALLVLLPGFLSARILDFILGRRVQDVGSQIVEGLIFSFMIYVVVAVPFGVAPVAVVEEHVGGNIQYTVRLSRLVVAAIALVSVLLPVALGYIVHSDLAMRVLRRLGITARTSRSSVWNDVFNDQAGRYVVVHLNDGRRLQGWPHYFADSPEDGQLYISDPAWLRDDNAIEPITNVHGVFIIAKGMIELVEFQRRTSEGASPAHEKEWS
jgi:hypothetical protein